LPSKKRPESRRGERPHKTRDQRKKKLTIAARRRGGGVRQAARDKKTGKAGKRGWGDNLLKRQRLLKKAEDVAKRTARKGTSDGPIGSWNKLMGRRVRQGRGYDF